MKKKVVAISYGPVVVIRWQQNKNGKKAIEETDGKSSRVHRGSKRWKGNIREGKKGTVLDVSNWHTCCLTHRRKSDTRKCVMSCEGSAQPPRLTKPPWLTTAVLVPVFLPSWPSQGSYVFLAARSFLSRGFVESYSCVFEIVLNFENIYLL